MSKGSGSLKSNYPSKKLDIYKNLDGQDIPELVENKMDLWRLYEDYKSNVKAGYDMSDESWDFVSKSGKFYSANEFEELPKIKKTDILFIQQNTAEGSTAWYDRSVKDYKEKIVKITAHVVK